MSLAGKSSVVTHNSHEQIFNTATENQLAREFKLPSRDFSRDLFSYFTPSIVKCECSSCYSSVTLHLSSTVYSLSINYRMMQNFYLKHEFGLANACAILYALC